MGKVHHSERLAGAEPQHSGEDLPSAFELDRETPLSGVVPYRMRTLGGLLLPEMAVPQHRQQNSKHKFMYGKAMLNKSIGLHKHHFFTCLGFV